MDLTKLRAALQQQKESLQLAPDPTAPSILDQFHDISETAEERRGPCIVHAELDDIAGHSYVVPITDTHVGSLSFMHKKMKAYLDWIVATPGVYAVGLGDLAENATKTSVGLGMFEEEYHLEKQMEVITELLAPVAKAGKLLGLHRGNHEYRTAIATGLDPIKIVCKELDVPYLKDNAYHIWTVGDQEYRVVTAHGRSGSRTPGGKLNAIMRMRDVADADVYLMGHMHDRLYYEDAPYTFDREGAGQRLRKYCVCGSLLSYFQTYAEMSIFSPVRQAWVLLDFHKQRKDVRIHF